MKKLFFLCLFLSISMQIKAQGDFLLNYFNAYSFNDSVILTWELSSGSTCNGIRIFRSSDSVNYTEIGEILGICGSNEEATPYRFVDQSPNLNSENYYYLELGINGKSSTRRIFFIKVDGQISLYPNPCVDKVTIQINNKENLKVKIELISIYGTILQSSNFPNGDNFSLETSKLINGTYIIQVRIDDKRLLNKKFQKYF